MPGIFISYRRGDSIGHTGRLYDLLSKHFGTAHVFMDIDTIGPGENFVEVIERTCDSCEVLLAVIGRSWISTVDQEGNRRLDDPGDFVRLEIVHAMKKGVRVVPVLVDGAPMPDVKAFPADLKQFALRNAWEITDKRFHHDVGQLIEALETMQPTLRPMPSAPAIEKSLPATPSAAPEKQWKEQQAPPANRKFVYIGIGAVVALVLALAVFFGRSTSMPSISITPGGKTAPAETYDIPSLQANVTGPLLFFAFAQGHPLPPPGERPYATNFQSARSSGKSMFWEVSLNFAGQFPPPDYQIESIWYRDSQEVFRGSGAYRGSAVPTRPYHDRGSWVPPGGHLPLGKYRVDLYVAGQKVTSGDFVVQP